MKIGIITYHSTTNYGATFQAQAVQLALVNVGHTGVCIDYLPKYFDTKSRINLKYLLKNIWAYYWGILNIRQYKVRKIYFSEYRKRHISVTDHKYTTYQDLSITENELTSAKTLIHIIPEFSEITIDTPYLCLGWGYQINKYTLEQGYKVPYWKYSNMFRDYVENNLTRNKDKHIIYRMSLTNQVSSYDEQYANSENNRIFYEGKIGEEYVIRLDNIMSKVYNSMEVMDYCE